MPQMEVVRDVHNGGRPMDDEECFRPLRMSARLDDGVQN